MIDRGSAPDRPSNSTSRQRLTISYPTQRKMPHGGRRVVFIRYGELPVTEAEVEIMRLHLDCTIGKLGPLQVDNDR